MKKSISAALVSNFWPPHIKTWLKSELSRQDLSDQERSCLGRIAVDERMEYVCKKLIALNREPKKRSAESARTKFLNLTPREKQKFDELLLQQIIDNDFDDYESHEEIYLLTALYHLPNIWKHSQQRPPSDRKTRIENQLSEINRFSRGLRENRDIVELALALKAKGVATGKERLEKIEHELQFLSSALKSTAPTLAIDPLRADDALSREKNSAESEEIFAIRYLAPYVKNLFDSPMYTLVGIAVAVALGLPKARSSTNVADLINYKGKST